MRNSHSSRSLFPSTVASSESTSLRTRIKQLVVVSFILFNLFVVGYYVGRSSVPVQERYEAPQALVESPRKYAAHSGLTNVEEHESASAVVLSDTGKPSAPHTIPSTTILSTLTQISPVTERAIPDSPDTVPSTQSPLFSDHLERRRQQHKAIFSVQHSPEKIKRSALIDPTSEDNSVSSSLNANLHHDRNGKTRLVTYQGSNKLEVPPVQSSPVGRENEAEQDSTDNGEGTRVENEEEEEAEVEEVEEVEMEEVKEDEGNLNMESELDAEIEGVPVRSGVKWTPTTDSYSTKSSGVLVSGGSRLQQRRADALERAKQVSADKESALQLSSTKKVQATASFLNVQEPSPEANTADWWSTKVFEEPSSGPSDQKEWLDEEDRDDEDLLNERVAEPAISAKRSYGTRSSRVRRNPSRWRAGGSTGRRMPGVNDRIGKYMFRDAPDPDRRLEGPAIKKATGSGSFGLGEIPDDFQDENSDPNPFFPGPIKGGGFRTSGMSGVRNTGGPGYSATSLRKLWDAIAQAHEEATQGAGLGQGDHFLNSKKLELEVIERARGQWEAFVAVAPTRVQYSNIFQGKGIVTCGGGKYFAQTWTNIKVLRAVGCTLPIELWITNGEEPPERILPYLRDLNVQIRNIDSIVPRIDGGLAELVRGYALKVFSVLFSSFSEVLYLDADNTPARDPTYLFTDSLDYRREGALFWPDFWLIEHEKLPAIETITGGRQGLLAFGTMTFESGQMLINKGIGWMPLMLGCFMNLEKKLYYMMASGIGEGDKDVLPLAWAAVTKSVPKIHHPVAAAGETHERRFFGHTMLQFGPRGEALFLHRNLLKWSVCDKQVDTDPFHRGHQRKTWEAVQYRPNRKRDPIIVVIQGTGGRVRFPMTGAKRESNQKEFSEVVDSEVELEETAFAALRSLVHIVPELKEACSREMAAQKRRRRINLGGDGNGAETVSVLRRLFRPKITETEQGEATRIISARTGGGGGGGGGGGPTQQDLFKPAATSAYGRLMGKENADGKGTPSYRQMPSTDPKEQLSTLSTVANKVYGRGNPVDPMKLAMAVKKARTSTSSEKQTSSSPFGSSKPFAINPRVTTSAG